MNYEIFKQRNNSNKSNCRIDRIINVALSDNKCTLLIDNVHKSIRISDLVLSIISGKGCISNPSALINYNFDKFIANTKKHKDVLKERRLNQIEIDKVSNHVRSELLNSSGLLYHGSDGGIIGNVDCNSNRGLCDFGNGFYTGDNLLQAENRIANKSISMIYAYKYDFNNLKVYTFDNIVLWALFVGYNRGIIKVDSAKLMKLFNNIVSNYDIIIGYIADDKISESFNDFLNGNITDVCLSECLKLVQYGKQVVFKNQSSLDSIKLYKSYVMTKSMKKVSTNWGREIRSNMDSHLESYKKLYRNTGKYIDEYKELF